VIKGDESERVETLTEDAVKDEIMGVLRKMYPNIKVPEPKAMLYKKWFSDPLFRGTWSNWPAG
jgi:polyamine oxidase